MKLILRFLAPFLFLLLAALSFFQSIHKPYNNWDMIGYIAAAESFEENDIHSLHSFTYNQLRHSVSNEEYNALVRGNYYRYVIAADPSAFKEQLPFYQIRPVYVGIIYMCYKAGIGIAFATHIISGIAVVGAVALLYLMCTAFLAKPFVYVVPIIALYFNILDLAKWSTPDGLAFLSIILSAYLYLNKRFSLLLILLPFILGIRTDLILFTIPLLIFIFAFEKNIRWKVILSTVISVAIYICIGSYWGNPGWSTIFYHTMVHLLTHPISIPPTLVKQDYFNALYYGFESSKHNSSFLLYGFVVTCSLYLFIKNVKTMSFAIALKSPASILTVTCLIFVVLHFLALPVLWERFFTGPYLIGVFSLLMMLTNNLKPIHR